MWYKSYDFEKVFFDVVYFSSEKWLFNKNYMYNIIQKERLKRMEQEVFIDEVCDNFFKKMNSLYIEYIIGSKNALLFYHNVLFFYLNFKFQ